MAARTSKAQACKFNGESLGGLATITVRRGFGRVAQGILDGSLGGDHGIARGDKFVNGTLTHEDVEEMITLITATPALANSQWYEKMAGAATYSQRQLATPKFGRMTFDAATGAKAKVTHEFECEWAAGNNFADVDTLLLQNVTAATVTALLIAQVSVGDPVVCTFDPTGTAIALGALRSVSFTLEAEIITDSDPGSAGRTAVEVRYTGLTFSVTMRDTTSTGTPLADLVQQLFARTSANLLLEFEVKGATANTKITLANAVFTEGPRESRATGFTEFTMTGRCNWVTTAGLRYDLTGTNKMIVITPATFA